MAGKGVAQVVNRCDSAKEDKNLNLSHCELTQIPDAIFLLMRNTALQTCDLSENLLKRIPSKFATKFPSLTVLNVSSNHLTSLPDELRHMENLVSLDISSNHFSTLPSVIYRMESLKDIKAEGNTIKDVDVSRLKKLPNLKEINLKDNPLSQEVHSELKALDNSIFVVSTPQDPEFDSVD